jgi:hypothetical protein
LEVSSHCVQGATDFLCPLAVMWVLQDFAQLWMTSEKFKHHPEEVVLGDSPDVSYFVGGLEHFVYFP